MNPIPADMLRIELLHPLTVHFPIALLLVATALEVVSSIMRPERRSFARSASLLLLILGVIGAWTSVWSGEEAEHIVEKMICDEELLENHEELATLVSWIFSGVAILAIIRRLKPALKFLSFLIAVTSIVGSVGLGYVGHLGATLVYQQGAAVQRPATDCQANHQPPETH